MAGGWLTTMKPSFQTEWLALPPKDAHQVLEKINLLAQDPHPDSKVKKQLKYLDGKLHRIRSGDYRIFYTFDEKYVSLLALRRRSDETYDEDYDVEFLGGLEVELGGGSGKAVGPDWEKIFATQPQEKTRLPEPITEELLGSLRVPKECFTRLTRLENREDLLNCPGIPDEILLKLDEYLFERPLVLVTQQPDYLLSDINDLLRFKEGELLAFLLKLSPEQEKFVSWGVNATGPTLVKGGPGTGKSTVALYRVRSILAMLRKKGVENPRILFTTYTNALVKSSRQLLEQLLGADARFVEVQTADSLVWSILAKSGEAPNYANNEQLRGLLRQAVGLAQSRFEGNALQKAAQVVAIERISIQYLLDEILTVIVGRQLGTLETYLVAARAGRKMPLNASQRKAIWKVQECLNELLNQSGQTTFSHARDLAQALQESASILDPFQAVVIDEAQDLDPSVLRILVELCESPNRLFITADANQSIYGSGFNWNDVHQNLRFQGRTGILRANYRSTREVGEAAQAYLAADMLDAEAVDREYINSGPMPVVRAVHNSHDEALLLARFLPGAAREYRLGVSACAVFCPTENAGRAIAERLTKLGIAANFMSGKELDLSRQGVKVLTLKSSKGLEFPIVALAGFLDSRYPNLPADLSAEETEEILGRERRTMFVGMTRAMRALMLIVPSSQNSPLLKGFNSTYWNVGKEGESL